LSFKPAGSPEEREKAIEEWREWLKERERKFKKRLKRSEN
jgi:trimethylamine:corrinoid methyltransferase-like protein